MSANTTATIVPFPLARAFTQADIAQVSSWAANAEQDGCFLRDAATGIGGVRWIGRTPEGEEFFSVAHGHRGNGAYYTVVRRRGRWHVYNMLYEFQGEFRTLGDALDAISPPPIGAA